MLIITVVCALLIISFYLAMNTANIWVLIDDGLDARAGVVLMGEDADKLTSYFKPEFIAQDPVLHVAISRLRDPRLRSSGEDGFRLVMAVGERGACRGG